MTRGRAIYDPLGVVKTSARRRRSVPADVIQLDLLRPLSFSEFAAESAGPADRGDSRSCHEATRGTVSDKLVGPPPYSHRLDPPSLFPAVNAIQLLPARSVDEVRLDQFFLVKLDLRPRQTHGFREAQKNTKDSRKFHGDEEV